VLLKSSFEFLPDPHRDFLLGKYAATCSGRMKPMILLLGTQATLRAEAALPSQSAPAAQPAPAAQAAPTAEGLFPVWLLLRLYRLYRRIRTRSCANGFC
jgi:hypothetical protein